jgi:urate oxidase
VTATTTGPATTGNSAFRLGAHAYGKTGVRVAKVERSDLTHAFHDLTLRLWLEGDFSAAYLAGDNSTSLPTDTMRATAYALAADLPLAETERYLEAVARRLLEATPAASSAHVEAVVHQWDRATVNGRPHPYSFHRGNGDGAASVVASRDGGVVVTSGVTDLLVAKTTGSEYSGFLKDEYTVLTETTDRIMATSIDAEWTWTSAPSSYAAARARAREIIEGVFATHHSLAVQHTLFTTGEALLAALPEAASVSLRMPNRHHVPVDLSPFGRENANEVFVVLDRPFGVIEGTVER